MRHVVIGTAGHVDHGKTCLVKALTGIDTDRLKEEKKRGITIELGFAYLDFPNGERAGIIDVPGHEKFIRHMLAGAGGIDVALLTVAADEGVMPQTEEHLDILAALGIKKGVVALTKADLAQDGLLELVREDVIKLLEGTFLENAPIVPVSIVDGQGLGCLREILMQICSSVPEKKDTGIFRLPVDRAFSVKGYGTVVTGTLLEGSLSREKEAVLYPQGVPVKIRGIQVHGEPRERAFPGERAAVNLSDKKKEEIHRGDILASAGSLCPSYMLDVRVQCLPHARRKIVSGMRVHVYHGARELMGRIILMGREVLAPGDACYGQLRLETCTAAKKWDRFVLRFYSPQETIGGGMILDACPSKKKRNDKRVLDIFRVKESGNEKEQLEQAILENWGKFGQLGLAAIKCGIYPRKAQVLAEELCREEKIFPLKKGRYLHKRELDYYQKKIEAYLGEFHKNFPLEDGMGLEEARSRLGLCKNEIADAIFFLLTKQKVIRSKDGYISLYFFQAADDGVEHRLMEQILHDFETAEFAPLATSLYKKKQEGKKNFQKVFMALLRKGKLVDLGGLYCLEKKQYEKAWEGFLNLAQEQGIVKTGEYRDRLGCSRKMAIAILETFDKKGLTVNTEEGRFPKQKQ